MQAGEHEAVVSAIIPCLDRRPRSARSCLGCSPSASTKRSSSRGPRMRTWTCGLSVFQWSTASQSSLAAEIPFDVEHQLTGEGS